MALGLDYETFGTVDLRKRGLDRYVNGPGFTPLMASVSDKKGERTYDFILDSEARESFEGRLHQYSSWGTGLIAAHNAGFERAVLRFQEIPENYWAPYTLDTAVLSRAQGAASHLEAAAPQLTDQHKLDEGKELIQLFSVPNEWNQGRPFTREEIRGDQELGDKWGLFRYYCERDAKASRILAEEYYGTLAAGDRERGYELLTDDMNQAGWPVDLVLVREMQLRYEQNVQDLEEDIRATYGDLNINSTAQLAEFCATRGVRSTSFDADHVKSRLALVTKRLATMTENDPRYRDYSEVQHVLSVKQELGGSSLKKLQVILDTVSGDGRLRNQYMHLGAGQSYRTTGKGVQMQNLKRLGKRKLDRMEDLYSPELHFDNDTMGENLRQVFTSSQKDGQLFVGDLASVESRALAWWTGADWKIDAYRAGKELYKVQAQEIYGVAYEDVTPEQRQVGKIGELSCGYGAGRVSVKSFAHGYGLELTDEDAQKIVDDWRGINPDTVNYWYRIDAALKEAVRTRVNTTIALAHDLHLVFRVVQTPASLLAQHPTAQSISMELWRSGKRRQVLIMERMFQGCYERGRNVCYYKPATRKTGDLWKGHYRDPKTGQVKFYDLYGGKLAGILTQSLCRELFFVGLANLSGTLKPYSNVTIIGQFHDEIVVDWVPGELSQNDLEGAMQRTMTTPPEWLRGFPLGAEVKHAYRYIK